MTITQDLGDLMAARRADLEGNARSPGEVEVIPPADPATGEILPAAAPPAAQAAPAPPDYSLIPAKVLGGLPYASDYWRLAQRVCNTDMVPSGFRGRADSTFAAIMRGVEMGFAPFQALNSFNVIQGNVGLKPEAMRALIFDAGHEIMLDEVYDQAGKLIGIRADCRRATWEEWRSYTYTLQDATMAGLISKENWKKQPRAMLEARATAGAGRRYFADVLAGMSYTPEEISDFDRPGPSAATTEEAAPSAQTTIPEAETTTDTASPATGQPASRTTSASEGTSAPAKKARGTTKKAPAKTGAKEQIEEHLATSTTEPPCNSDPATGSRSDSTQTTTSSPSDNGPGASAQATFPQSAITPSTEDSGSDATDAADESVIQPTEVSTPSDQTASPPTSEEGPVVTQLARSLGVLLDKRPQAEQPLIRTFLGRHFPGRKAVDLNAEELTKAINIVAGWPGSADTYPAPDAVEE